jgi:signal transduction histidine kinase
MIIFLVVIFIIFWFVNALYSYIFISDSTFAEHLFPQIPDKDGYYRIIFFMVITVLITLTHLFTMQRVEKNSKEKLTLNEKLKQCAGFLEEAQNSVIKYRKLYESVKHPIISLDKSYNCLLANHSFLELFDCDEASSENKNIIQLISNQKLLDSLLKALAKTEDSGEYQFDISIYNKNQLMDFSISLYTSYGLQGNPENYVIILCDTSEQRKMDRLKILEKQQNDESNKMISLGTLSAGMAHEINNPNNAIMMNASLLLRIFSDMKTLLNEAELSEMSFGGFTGNKIDEKIQIMIDGILSGSGRIKNITDELRDFARKDSSKYEKVDVNEIIKSSIKSFETLGEENNVSIKVELNKGRPIYTRGIYTKIEQVFTNLLKNAYDSLSKEEKSIEIIARIDQKIRKIVVLINDSGSGMDDETMKHIRDPFFTTKRSTGGIGLGLSIAGRIIEQHGGTLDFISMRGSGTTAIINLPLWEDLIH